MIELGPSYKQVGSLESSQGIIDYWVSSQTTDPEWDRLLATTDQGQYQQTAMWAGYKASEGWNTHRIVCFSKGEWVGGCQCLWRSKGPIRIGYAIKGPVTRVYSDELATALGAILLREVRRLGISLLVAQLPDSSPAESRALESLGFLRSNPFQVIQATCLIRTDDGTDEIRRRMNRSTKHHVNRARSRGVEIREGKESDLPAFFQLMLGSCERQKTKPNPSSITALQSVWANFSRSQSIRLSFAVCEGEVTAAALCLGFAGSLSLWKKGWNSRFEDRFPNALLYAEVFEWAFHHGFKWVDHCAFDLRAALHARQTGSLEGVDFRPRDAFVVRLGGTPRVLPPALVYVTHPALRFLYRKLYVPRQRGFYPA